MLYTWNKYNVCQVQLKINLKQWWIRESEVKSAIPSVASVESIL